MQRRPVWPCGQSQKRPRGAAAEVAPRRTLSTLNFSLSFKSANSIDPIYNLALFRHAVLYQSKSLLIDLVPARWGPYCSRFCTDDSRFVSHLICFNTLSIQLLTFDTPLQVFLTTSYAVPCNYFEFVVFSDRDEPQKAWHWPFQCLPHLWGHGYSWCECH